MSKTAVIARRSGLAVTTAVAAAALAACGSGSPATQSGAGSTGPSPSASAPVSGPYNQQDVMFAQMMIPHHRQAIAMSETELVKGQSSQVKQLARAIKKAQGPEIQQMQGWLHQWHATTGSTTTGHGHSDGMMSQQQMNRFNEASGTKLDRLFLQMMIKHHEGAVDMAQTEIQHGQNPQAIKLAHSIASSQQDQITQMKRMLASV